MQPHTRNTSSKPTTLQTRKSFTRKSGHPLSKRIQEMMFLDHWEPEVMGRAKELLPRLQVCNFEIQKPIPSPPPSSLQHSTHSIYHPLAS